MSADEAADASGGGPPGYLRSRDVAAFEHWAPTYDRSNAQRLFFDRVHRAVLRLGRTLQPSPDSILDIGCGTGRLLQAAGGEFPEAQLVGIDPAPGMIAAATSKLGAGGRSRCLVASASGLPLASQTVDLVFSTSSFHHWDDQGAGLREVRRVLRPHGAFVLADGYRSKLPHLNVKRHRSSALEAHIDDPERIYSRRTLARMLEVAGFNVITQQRALALRWLVLISAAVPQ
jgi:ubiquinone/menaquinone biosynthesis C-methylase UbiE